MRISCFLLLSEDIWTPRQLLSESNYQAGGQDLCSQHFNEFGYRSVVNTRQSQNRQIPSHTTLVALVKPATKKKRRKVAFQKSGWENHVRKDSELALNCNIQSSRAKEGFCSWMREGSSSIFIKHHRERKVSLDVMEMKQPEVNLHITWKPPERGWKPWDYLGHLKLSWIRWIRHPITHSEEKPLLTSWGGTPKGPTHISYAPFNIHHCTTGEAFSYPRALPSG